MKKTQKKAVYEKPELTTREIELGVFGDYGDDGGDGDNNPGPIRIIRYDSLHLE